MLGLFLKFLETSEFKLLLQWVESQCWNRFWSFQKPMNLSCFHDGWKPMLRSFQKFSEMDESQCWDHSEGFINQMKLGYFTMRESQCWYYFWRFSETNVMKLFSQWAKANVRTIIEVFRNHVIEVLFQIYKSSMLGMFSLDW